MFISFIVFEEFMFALLFTIFYICNFKKFMFVLSYMHTLRVYSYFTKGKQQTINLIENF